MPEGRFAFTIDAEERIAEAGGSVKVPEDAAHGFRTDGEASGRLLVLNARGAIHDRCFAEAGEPMPQDSRCLPADPPPPDIERLRRAAAAAGMELVEP